MKKYIIILLKNNIIIYLLRMFVIFIKSLLISLYVLICTVWGDGTFPDRSDVVRSGAPRAALKVRGAPHPVPRQARNRRAATWLPRQARQAQQARLRESPQRLQRLPLLLCAQPVQRLQQLPQLPQRPELPELRELPELPELRELPERELQHPRLQHPRLQHPQLECLGSEVRIYLLHGPGVFQPVIHRGGDVCLVVRGEILILHLGDRMCLIKYIPGIILLQFFFCNVCKFLLSLNILSNLLHQL